jgi:hypothetical protein
MNSWSLTDGHADTGLYRTMSITTSSWKTGPREAGFREVFKAAESLLAKCRDKRENLDSIHEFLVVLVQHTSDLSTIVLEPLGHVGSATAGRLWLSREARQTVYGLVVTLAKHTLLMRRKESVWGDEDPVFSDDENLNIQINDLVRQGLLYNTEQPSHGDIRERPVESSNQSVHESIAPANNPQRINTQQECLQTNADNPSLLTPDEEPVILSEDDRSTSSGTDCNESRMVHLRLPQSSRKRPAEVANPGPSKFARNERALRPQARRPEGAYSDDQPAIETPETSDDDDECPPDDEGDVEGAREGHKGNQLKNYYNDKCIRH